MRTLIGWLLLAAVVPASAGELPAYPFINVTGHALKAVSPDLARVNFTVKVRDPSAENAAHTVSAGVQSVLTLLQSAGIAAADIDAHEVSKQVVFERDSAVSGTARRGLPVYEVSRSFSVLLRDVAAWPDLGSRLIEMQNIEDVGAQFDRTDRAALEAELVAAAAKDAQQRAERLAAGFGQHLGAVQAVSQDPFEEISMRFLRADTRYAYQGDLGGDRMFKASLGRNAAAQVLVPATIPLAASVNAIYRLESAPR